MKKVLSILAASVLVLGLFSGCGQKKTSTIVVGATPTPHAEILEIAKGILVEQGYTLEVKEFVDYIQPNLVVASGEVDANYFQHQPYLDDFNEKNGTDLVSILAVHYEPLGIYAGKTASLADLADGAQIAVPSDPTNEARALLLLEVQGLITVDPAAGLNATIRNITSNPKNLDIVEIEAAQLARALQDVDLAVINGNYAIQAGLNASDDALAKEEKDSLAAQSYANVLVVKKGQEDREDLKALAAALSSDQVKQFIADNYQGAVVSIL